MAYDLFVSYARTDNNRPANPGVVTAFVEALIREHRRNTTDELSVFFDQDEIRVGQDWELRLQSALRDSNLLLALMSPHYFESPWCHREWEEFTRHEGDRVVGGEGIYPIYLDEVRQLHDDASADINAAWLDDLRRRQRIDCRAWFAAGAGTLDRDDVHHHLELLDQQLDARIVRLRRVQASPGTVDQHNRAFVGRQNDLRHLRGMLTGDGALGGIAVIHGLAGVGKSALATEYSHRFAAEYPGGRWLIPCEGLADLPSALLRLAAPLGIVLDESESRDADLAAQRIIRELATRTDATRADTQTDPACLLLLDNVDDAALLAPAETARLPVAAWLHILVTTRLSPDHLATQQQRDAKERQFLAVDELPEDEALQLMQRHQPGGRFASEADALAARGIVQRLGGFTLAVEAVAVYLGLHPDIAAEDFLRRLAGDELTTSDDVAATVDLRHRRERRDNQLAMLLGATEQGLSGAERFVLTCAAVLPSDQIPLPWIRVLTERLFPELVRSEPGYPSPWPQLVRRLLGRRLLVETADLDAHGDRRIVRMHRLVQDYFLTAAPDAWRACEAELIDHAVARATHSHGSWRDPDSQWEIFALAACVPRWARPDNPRVLELAIQLGTPLMGLGMYREAETMCRQAASALGDGLSLPAILLLTLTGATTAVASNTAPEAEAILRRALQAAETTFGPESSLIPLILQMLAGTLIEESRYEDAVEVAQRAARALARQGGTDRESEAMTLLVQAAAHCGDHQLEPAARAAREALAVLDADGDSAPSLVRPLAMMTLGVMDAQTGRLAEGESMLRQAVSASAAVLSPEHPVSQMLRGTLAGVLARAGRTAEAEPLLRQVIDSLEHTFGENHHGLIFPYGTLGALLQTTRRPSDAEPLYRRVVSITTATYGEQSADVATALVRLGTLLGEVGKTAEAATVLQRAVAIQETLFGPDDPEVAQSLIIMAAVALKERNGGAGLARYRRGKAILDAYARRTGQPHRYAPLLKPLTLMVNVVMGAGLGLVLLGAGLAVWLVVTLVRHMLR